MAWRHWGTPERRSLGPDCNLGPGASTAKLLFPCACCISAGLLDPFIIIYNSLGKKKNPNKQTRKLLTGGTSYVEVASANPPADTVQGRCAAESRSSALHAETQQKQPCALGCPGHFFAMSSQTLLHMELALRLSCVPQEVGSL